MNDLYLYFLQDSIPMIVENSIDAKREKDATDSGYDKGRLMAYYEVISLLQQQASAFGIPLVEIGLNKIKPDIDLL